MQSDTHPAYARSTSLNLAAALSVVGIPVGLDQSVDRISGKGWKTFLFGLESVPYGDIGAKVHESDPAPSYKTQTLVGMLRKGMLHEQDSHHPVLDVLRACEAREKLMEWIRSGVGCRLVKVEGASRYQLVTGDEPESVRQLEPGFMTRDLKLAAALCVLGCPIVKISGSPGSSEIYFAVRGYGMPSPVTSDLAQAYRNKTLEEIEPEHPLLWAMQGLKNRDAIADMANRKKSIVLVRAPGTGRASLVSENAKGSTMDRVKKHLRIA